MRKIIFFVYGWMAISLSGMASAREQSASPPSTVSSGTQDPYLWLEGVTDEKALLWVKKQNERSTQELQSLPVYQEIRSRLLGIYDSNERIPYLEKLGESYYNFWRDQQHPRGLWRRTTLEEYRKALPNWETVLDLDLLAQQEKENWVWQGAQCLYPKRERCLLSLSRGGADASVVREFDTNSKTFIQDGFNLPEAKSAVNWRDQDSIYVGTDFGKGSLTNSGYPRQVRQWKRGQSLAQAQLVFEGEPDDVSVSGNVLHDHGRVYDLIIRGITFYSDEVYLREGDRLIRVDKPDDAEFSVFGSQLLLKLRSAWTPDKTTYPAGSLLAADEAQYRNQKRDFSVLFAPDEHRSLAGFSATKNFLLINELDNVRSRLSEWKWDGNQWTPRKVEVPAYGAIRAEGVDETQSDDYFLILTDFLTPSSLHLGTAGSDQREKLKSLPAFFKNDDLHIEQLEALSKDGTHIPYFVVSRKNLKLDGQNPTLLYGYGGFEVSLPPYYSAAVGAAWLEKGGVYVLANIRGGGEFGPNWHQAAIKERRQNVHDDFAAVAQNLIDRKVTSPVKLGIMGASNGGLLMGVMLVQHPELFGAIVCQVPLLDMKRFHKLLAGASWMGEYGDPDRPEDWTFISRYSPYHNLARGMKLPPVFFTTSTRDDRVHPGHARKMVALMSELGYLPLYYENIEGGHNGAANNEQRAIMDALAYTFLQKQLGLIPVSKKDK